MIVQAGGNLNTASVMLRNAWASSRRTIYLIALATLGVGCQPAYDVTAEMSGGAIHFLAAPSRPRSAGDLYATVFIGGSKILVARTGPPVLVFPDGNHLNLPAPEGSLPFPEILREAPTEENVSAEVMTCELYLTQILRTRPQALEQAMHPPDSAIRLRAIEVARQMVNQGNPSISGLIGRWWYFSGYYRPLPGARERLAAAIGAAGGPPATSAAPSP